MEIKLKAKIAKEARDEGNWKSKEFLKELDLARKRSEELNYLQLYQKEVHPQRRTRTASLLLQYSQMRGGPREWSQDLLRG